MIERQPAASPLEDFLADIHPGTGKWAGEKEREVLDARGEDLRALQHAQAWLHVYGDEPAANPDHVKYYESEVERLSKKLEGSYGEA